MRLARPDRPPRGPADRIAEVAAPPLRDQMLAAVRAAGFPMVALDLGGLRSGKLFRIARRTPRG